MKITKSLEHIKLEFANKGKLEKLEKLAGAYLQFMQAVIDHYWKNNIIAGKYVKDCGIETPLSERYKQTAGLQAIRCLRSWQSKIKEQIQSEIRQDVKKELITKEEASLSRLGNA